MKTRLWLAALNRMYTNIIHEYIGYITYNEVSEQKKMNISLSCSRIQKHIADAMNEIHNLTSLLK